MRTDAVWIGAILLAASLAVSSFVPSMFGYVAVLAVYVLFIGVLVATDRFAVVYHWAVAPMVLLIWAVFALTTALDPTAAGLLRLGAFTVITGINLFVVPATIDRTTFHDVLAVTAGAFVLIGLPTAFVGSYGVAGLTISPWDTTQTLVGVTLNTPVSIFDNPNYLSSFAALGAVAAGARYTRSRTPLAAGLVGLNALGVVLAGGRAALLALIVAAGLYAAYYLFGPTVMAAFVVFGALGVVVGFAMVFGIVPGPSAITQVNLGDRRATWGAAYEAVLDRPVFGWGPGNDSELLANYLRDSVDVTTTHNSYIRMFLISGILGGGAYLVLTISSVAIVVKNVQSEVVFTILLLVAFLIMQLFAGMTVFGLSLLSVLGALFVGYAQSTGIARRKEFDVRASFDGITSESTT